MPRLRERMTLIDYVVIGLNPLMIMALVGSLVFFLAEVLYEGKYHDSLLWVLFFFVFGAVLVSRIAIELDGNKALLYGFVLGSVTWVGMARFVDYGDDGGEVKGVVNLILLATIWWSADRLTRDCTMIDDSEDASGIGLLQLAGLDKNADAQKLAEEPPTKGRRRGNKDVPMFVAWWERYQRFRAETGKSAKAPGVWVVYFSLAALPLYGLGQTLIPADDEARRLRAFWLMTFYVASALGLLLTTSFLGLRRYLRQKKLKMPLAMTGVWLLMGTGLIAAFLMVGLLLPRPSAEFALLDLPWRATAEELEANKRAVQDAEAGKGDSKNGAQGKDGKSDAESSRRVDDGKGKDKGADKATATKDSKAATKSTDGKRTGTRNTPADNSPPSAFAKFVTKLVDLAKFIMLQKLVIGLFIVGIIFILGRAMLMFLAHFTDWADRLLRIFSSLWRSMVSERDEVAEEDEAKAEPPPFSVYGNPFESGTARHMAPGDLIRYSFDALEAWAHECGLTRTGNETPIEFATRIGEARPNLEPCAGQLAVYYASLAYGGGDVGEECREPIRRLWRQMNSVSMAEGAPSNRIAVP